MFGYDDVKVWKLHCDGPGLTGTQDHPLYIERCCRPAATSKVRLVSFCWELGGMACSFSGTGGCGREQWLVAAALCGLSVQGYSQVHNCCCVRVAALRGLLRSHFPLLRFHAVWGASKARKSKSSWVLGGSTVPHNPSRILRENSLVHARGTLLIRMG